MSWKFENAAPVIGSITEGNEWNGELMLYSNIIMNRIMTYDPDTRLVEVWRENTEGTNTTTKKTIKNKIPKLLVEFFFVSIFHDSNKNNQIALVVVI